MLKRLVFSHFLVQCLKHFELVFRPGFRSLAKEGGELDEREQIHLRSRRRWRLGRWRAEPCQ